MTNKYDRPDAVDAVLVETPGVPAPASPTQPALVEATSLTVQDDPSALEVVDPESYESGPRQGKKTLTNADIMWMLKLRADGKTQAEIGRRLNVTQKCISNYLKKFEDSTQVAKALAKAASEKLMKRVIEHANVDQALEVLDRTDGLPKKQKDSGGGVTINVGGDKVGVQVNNKFWD